MSADFRLPFASDLLARARLAAIAARTLGDLDFHTRVYTISSGVMAKGWYGGTWLLKSKGVLLLKDPLLLARATSIKRPESTLDRRQLDLGLVDETPLH